MRGLRSSFREAGFANIILLAILAIVGVTIASFIVSLTGNISLVTL